MELVALELTAKFAMKFETFKRPALP